MSSIQAGDVVVCVDAKAAKKGVKVRGTYRVTGTLVVPHRDGPEAGVTLAGLNPSPYRGWIAAAFRKVQRADDSFIAQIKACRPRHDRVPHNVESDRG